MKKGQLKIQEMAFMLVAVFLFFALVGLFVISLVYVNLHKEATRIAEERNLAALISLSDYPEFMCTSQKSNCIDADKLIALTEKQEYENFLPFTSLSVITYNAFNKSEKELIKCTLANYPNCDYFEIYNKKVENERSSSSFIVLCRKEFENGYSYDKCEIAKIIGGTEIK